MGEEKEYFKLDRTAFSMMTVEEANDHYGYWKDKSLKERWDAGCYLSMKIFGCDSHTAMDKTVFSTRKHKNG